MKTIRFGCRAACALLVFALVAQAAAAADLESLGLTLLSSQKDGDQTIWELQTSTGGHITVLADGEVTDDRVERAAYLYQSIVGWQWMDAPNLRVTVTGRRAEALVVPTRYAYDGLNLIQYLPSGMQFYLDTILEYDFRMKVGSLFLRMKGQFFDATELSARVASAARDPIKFLERTDPEYLFRTLQETTNAIQQLESGGANALRDLVAGYQELRDRQPILESRIAELEDKIQSAQDSLQAVQSGLQTAQGDLAALQASMATQLDAAMESTRAGILATGNAGLFSGPRPMNAAMVARVVELKHATATLTTADILATLKTEGITATKRQVDLILLVYFGPAT